MWQAVDGAGGRGGESGATAIHTHCSRGRESICAGTPVDAMSPPTIKTFNAVLEPLRNGLGWVIARIPFDVEKAWPERRRLRVRGEIFSLKIKTGRFAFRTS